MPSVSLGEKSLNVIRIEEEDAPIIVEWDAWENQQYKRKLIAYGMVRKWRLTCVETDVNWSNSAVPYLQSKASSGEAITFSADLGNRFSINTSVYVLGIELELDVSAGAQNIRTFIVQLREA
jgi:hypothetical protein